MLIFPAIDLYGGKVVRLIKGDYNQMTVYSDKPVDVAKGFVSAGIKQIHLVDLEGAKTGLTPNFELISRIKKETRAFCQCGGGIRDDKVVEKYLDAGIDRVILGTAAVENQDFLKRTVAKHGPKIAVSVDVENQIVKTRGWLNGSGLNIFDFLKTLEDAGVECIVCTDISKDGLLAGANSSLYRKCMETSKIRIIASGGVSSLEDIRQLKANGLYGAIIGKAYYAGKVDLSECRALAENGDAL